jgi:hypothetical protein
MIKKAGLVLVAVLTTGCGDGPAADDAAQLAAQFEEAVQGKQFGAACRLLSPDVQQSLDDCEQELQDAALPTVSGVADTAVYGQNGVVRWPTETVFVSRFPGGWRVIAAGCTPRQDRPYDCAISGS